MKHIRLFNTESEMNAFESDCNVLMGNNENNSVCLYMPPTEPSDDEFWYTTTDGTVVSFANANLGDAVLVSNTYSNGKGIAKFNRSVTDIYYLPMLSNVTSYTFGSAVTYVDDFACWYHNNLTDLTIIGNSSTVLNGRCFAWNEGLKHVTLPSGCNFSGYMMDEDGMAAAFCWDRSLETITCGDYVNHVVWSDTPTSFATINLGDGTTIPLRSCCGE